MTSCHFSLLIYKHVLGLGAVNREMATRWLPNTGEFFSSLASVIENAERQLSSASYETSEFLLRRVDEYERTLSTLQSRVGESYGSLPTLQNVMADLTYLCDRVSFLRSHFEQRHVLVWDNDCSLTESGQSNVGSLDTEHSQNESPGRPRFAISREQLDALHEDCGLRWSDISRMFGYLPEHYVVWGREWKGENLLNSVIFNLIITLGRRCK